MARAYSVDLREKVMSFIKSGGGKREAAKVFHIGEDTIYRWLRMGDLKPKKRTKYPQKVVVETLLAYVEKNKDHTLKEIGDALGLGAQTVWKWLRRFNITRKKRPRFTKNE